MKYELILNNGLVLKCETNNGYEEIMEMIYKHAIYIVQEDGIHQKNKSTYILPSKVSHFRFNRDEGKGTNTIPKPC